eukprot:4125374-Pyramimonas_sp.AAC.2
MGATGDAETAKKVKDAVAAVAAASTSRVNTIKLIFVQWQLPEHLRVVFGIGLAQRRDNDLCQGTQAN